MWLLHFVVANVAVQCVPPLKTTKNGKLHTEQLEILEITINIVKIGASLSAIKGEVNDHILGRRGLNREAGSRCNITSTKGSKE